MRATPQPAAVKRRLLCAAQETLQEHHRYITASNARLWFHFLQAKISKEKAEKDASLVKTVMETSGGDNAQLARKIHERYDRCVSLLCAGCLLRT